MVKLRALKTFSAGGAKLTMQGDTFDAPQDRAHEYLVLKLAEEVNAQPTQAPTTAPTEFAEENNFSAIRRANQDTEFADELGNTGEATLGANTDYTEEELANMNVKALRDLAKNIGVTGYSTMTKSELIFAIRAQQNQRGGV
jgi:hypothetical protein